MTKDKDVWSMLPNSLSVKVPLMRSRKDFAWNFSLVIRILLSCVSFSLEVYSIKFIKTLKPSVWGFFVRILFFEVKPPWPLWMIFFGVKLLDLGRPNPNKPPPNDNQSIKRKQNLRITIICYHVLPSGRLSFSVSTP